MMVMPITILFIDFATGLCENPRQQGLVGLYILRSWFHPKRRCRKWNSLNNLCGPRLGSGWL
jgi:hypothetical protein